LLLFPLLLHRDHGRRLIPGVRRKASKAREEVNRDSLLPDAHERPSEFQLSEFQLASVVFLA
jgi:hypothetical protein